MQIIEVTGFGVRSAVIRLRRRETPLQFVVYPMIHIGEPAYYAAVAAQLSRAQVIVAEGVRRGANNRPSALMAALTLSYSVLKFRRRAGLVEQDIDYKALGVPVVNPDIDMDEFRAAWQRAPLSDRMMMWCLLPVVIIGRLFGGTEAIWSRAMEVNDLPSDEDEMLAEAMPELDDAFLGERDRRLLAALQRLHEERGSEALEVAVVYGADHVPAVVHGLRSRYGYVARSGDWLTVVDLTKAPATPEPARIPRQSTARARSAVAEQTPAPRRTSVPSPPTEVAGAESDLPEVAEVVRLRVLVERQPETYLPRLAHALMVLSDQLADRGRPGEALEAADQAVDVAEDLRERFGAIYDPAGASAAIALGTRLQEVGRDDDARALYAEAVDILRGMHACETVNVARSQSEAPLRDGRDIFAWALLDLADAIARDLANNHPDRHRNLLVQVLRRVWWSFLVGGQIETWRPPPTPGRCIPSGAGLE